MLRRTIQIATLLSALIFIAMALCIIRCHFANDEFQVFRWNPATRTFTEARIHLLGIEVLANLAKTTALPSDNISPIRTRIGSANFLVVHNVWPPAPDQCPLFWANHFRCTPTCGINTNGLSNCWTIIFRTDAALFLAAILPTVWVIKQIRNVRQIQLASIRGFPVLEPIKS